MDCKWEKCLQDNHGCHTCRDQDDIGPAPPVPSGWKPDETMLRRMFLAGKDNQGRPWPPPLGEDLCDSWWGGIQKDSHKRAFQQIPLKIAHATRDDKPTIFCGIYTMEAAHSKTIRAMRETWAPRCDGWLAFSTKSDPRIPALNIEHQGKEEYTNMWQKSRAIWKYIGENYMDKYDYFILGGEDLFLIVDNLRAYLATLPGGPEADHFVGRRFKGQGPNNYFNSGGAGYVLSRATLRKYITRGFTHPDCAPEEHSAMEDVFMAQCLRRVFKIGLTDTRDAKGRERFHPFAPGSHLTWQRAQPGKEGWYHLYNQEWGLKYGTDCCAPDSVSFHFIKRGAMVRHLHSMLYECGKLTDWMY